MSARHVGPCFSALILSVRSHLAATQRNLIELNCQLSSVAGPFTSPKWSGCRHRSLLLSTWWWRNDDVTVTWRLCGRCVRVRSAGDDDIRRRDQADDWSSSSDVHGHVSTQLCAVRRWRTMQGDQRLYADRQTSHQISSVYTVSVDFASICLSPVHLLSVCERILHPCSVLPNFSTFFRSS